MHSDFCINIFLDPMPIITSWCVCQLVTDAKIIGYLIKVTNTSTIFFVLCIPVYVATYVCVPT